jgi:FKBP-type peptidyl-prolyl cis-trans isomerase (trigger factor)
MKFEFEVEVRPEFDLPDLEGIEIEKPRIEVTDETVDAEVAPCANAPASGLPRKTVPLRATR